MQTNFPIPKGHTPHICVTSATVPDVFVRVFPGQIPPAVVLSMEVTQKVQKIPYVPLLAVIFTGDSCVHAKLCLPLDKWTGEVKVPDFLTDEVLKGDYSRVTAWLCGFLEPACLNDSVVASTPDGQVVFGDKDKSPVGLTNMSKEGIPSVNSKKEKKELMQDVASVAGDVNDMIGSLQELLGLKRPAPKSKRKKVELVQEEFPLPVLEEEEKKEDTKLVKLRKEQQEIVDKYGYAALKEIAERAKQPILVDKPKS